MSRGGSGYEGFSWNETDGMVGLGDLASRGFESDARDVSADGSVIVGYGSSAAGQEAMFWTASLGMQSLRDYLLLNGVASAADWQLTDAYGISADGLTIAGVGINPDGQTEAWIATIPEPSTALLILIGASCYGCVALLHHYKARH